MLIIGLIISIFISVCLCIYCYYLRKHQQHIIELNAQRYQENKQIEKENKQLKQKQEDIVSGIQEQNALLKSLSETRIQMEKEAGKAAQELYDTKVNEALARVQELETDAMQEYERRLLILTNKLAAEREKISNIEAKQLAYIQAQQRQEEIASNQDYYRLSIDKIDLDDISLLRELQPRFSKKESIDKLIWEVYFKPAYDILMSHLFEGTKKVCGIYKITSLTTNQAYIGQSVDIRERFRQHIKTALSYSKATNMLYITMQKIGVEDFTFEILEEVPRDKLNERETYWIDFYKTKDYGLNSTRGGS